MQQERETFFAATGTVEGGRNGSIGESGSHTRMTARACMCALVWARLSGRVPHTRGTVLTMIDWRPRPGQRRGSHDGGEWHPVRSIPCFRLWGPDAGVTPSTPSSMPRRRESPSAGDRIRRIIRRSVSGLVAIAKGPRSLAQALSPQSCQRCTAQSRAAVSEERVGALAAQRRCWGRTTAD